jgi:hypothetical protein
MTPWAVMEWALAVFVVALVAAFVWEIVTDRGNRQ